MKNLSDCFKLNNGIEIPCMGFGTWQTPNGEVAVSAVKEAISSGYRHIDTAAIYGNEKSVGQAIRESGVKREDLFITTKLWNTEHGYESTLKAFEISMDKLGLDYLDLYLIHWPNPPKFRPNYQEANAQSWKAMEELCSAGKIRAIGISNFLPHHMDELLKTAKIIPAVNQIRLYPGFTMSETVNYCKERGILLEAYSPFGTGQIFDAPELRPISEKYKKTPAQICLRWSLQMGFLPLPKTSTLARVKENADVFDFELSPDDMNVLTNMKNYCGILADPDTADF